MPRAKRGNKRLQKRKDLQKLASGYRGTKSKLYRSMRESVQRGLKFAYVGRKLKKRQYRALWIVRLNAAARLNGMSYSQFMHGLKVAAIDLDRKILSDIAIHDPNAFTDLANAAKKAISGKYGSAYVAANPIAAEKVPASKADRKAEQADAPAAEATPVVKAAKPKAEKPAVAAPVAAPVVEAAVAVPVVEAAAPVVAEPVTETPVVEATASKTSDLVRISDLNEEDDHKLNAAGIWLCSELLEKGATKAGRAEIASISGCEEKSVLRWVNQVDLFSRITGVNEALANLLEAAGVDTVVELATRVPANLTAKLAETNEAEKIVETVPTEAEVGAWVAQAKELPRVISH